MADLLQVACVHDRKNPPVEIHADSQYDDAQQLHQDTDIDEKRAQKSPRRVGSDGELSSTQVEEKQNFNFGLNPEQEEDLLCQNFLERAVVKEKTKGCETPHHHHGDMVATTLIQAVDVGTVNPGWGNLCENTNKQRTCEEGESEFSPSQKGTQGKATHAGSGLSKHERQQEQSKHVPSFHKQAGRSVVEEPEFTIDNSSWPTLAEAQNAKSIRCRGSQAHILQARSSSSDEGMDQLLSTPQRVPSSQANEQECPVEVLKHANAKIPTSKSKSFNKRGGFCKPSLTVTENQPGLPTGGHAPHVNMVVPNHTLKGNGLVGINNYFPGPHQAPAHGPFYFPRAESLALFQQSPAVPFTYGTGHPVWQHSGRGYDDAKPKHAGFRPRFDQQVLVPRHMHPQVVPFMNMNVTPYNYSSYQGDMSCVPGAPSLCFNYVTPYPRPSWHQGGTLQAAPMNIFIVQEMLQKQIDYYFSVENLCHDTFLKSKMNDEGFVPLSLIASFPRVRSLTGNTMIILEALKKSTVVEVKNGQLRSHDWRRWKVPSSSNSGMQSNPSGLSKYSMAENTRVQENGELQGFQEGHLDNQHSSIRS